MMTLENYLAVAYVLLQNQETDENPFANIPVPAYDLEELKDQINRQDDYMAEDGWVDYGDDRVNTMPDGVEAIERHKEKYDPEKIKAEILAAKEEEERR